MSRKSLVFPTSRRPSSKHAGIFVVVCAILLGGSLGSVPAAGASPLDGLLLVSDFSPNARIRIMDPVGRTIVYDYVVDHETYAGCGDPLAVCIPSGARHVVHGGNDYLDMVLTVLDNKSDWDVGLVYSMIQRVTPTPVPQVVWRIEHLDFSTLSDGDAYCDPADERDLGCQLSFSEGFDVVQDRPTERLVTLVAADAHNSRVLQVTLDYSNGNTTARVDWVLGKTNPAWPLSQRTGKAWPNAVDYLDDPDGPFLLTTFMQSDGVIARGTRLILWRWENGGWTPVWYFPDPAGGALALLNTPHMGEVLVDPQTGRRWLWYSHSRGAAEAWGSPPTGYGATWGLLALGPHLSDPPIYVFDAGLFDEAGDPLVNFSRDVAFLSDGSLLLMDAACQNICPFEAVVYHVGPVHRSAEPSGKAGYYSSDHREQVMLDLSSGAVLDEIRCGFGGLFEMDWIGAAEVGEQLQTAWDQGGRPCPGE